MPSKRRDRFDDDDRPRRHRWEDDEDDEPPRRTMRRKKSNNRMLMSVSIVVGGLAVAGLVVALVVAQVGRKTGGDRAGDDEFRMTPGKIGVHIDNPDYATPGGIAKHLGSGRVIPQDDWSRIKLVEETDGVREERSLASKLGYYPGKPVPTVYHWAGQGVDLYVAFWPPSNATVAATPKRTALTYHHTPGDKPIILTNTGW